MTSSIADYVFENGRRYHRYAEGQYLLPNDELEQERLELHHFIYLMLLRGKHFLAPIDKPKRILDVGTGTGIWAMDMAEKFPHAEVIGTDLSPIQPSWTLPNCTFIIDDAELEWHWPRPFDFVHARNLGQSIKDWQALALQMFQHTAPGGWVELAETNNRVVSDDDSIPADSALARIVRANLEGVQRLGLRTPDGDELRLLLAHAGFVDIEVRRRRRGRGRRPGTARAAAGGTKADDGVVARPSRFTPSSSRGAAGRPTTTRRRPASSCSSTPRLRWRRTRSRCSRACWA